MDPRFEVLGAMRVLVGGGEVDAGPSQQRIMLAALVLRDAVRTDTLIDVVWPSAPATAGNTVHKYVSRLRRLCEPNLPKRHQGHVIRRTPHGYRLMAGSCTTDLADFRDLIVAASQADDPAFALNLYERALRIWRGQCCADLPPEISARLPCHGVNQEYVDAAQAAAEVAIGCGQPQRIIGALAKASDWDPWNEGIWARLMLALTSAGRQADALMIYRDVERRLRWELGVEPGDELRAVHRAVLNGARPVHMSGSTVHMQLSTRD
jgi:DNA-binding SARP family transcriptional activator